MNSKGIVFTLIALLLALSLLSLASTIKSARVEARWKSDTAAALVKANAKFENIAFEAVYLDRNGFARAAQERLLPFKYSVDGNRLRLVQEVPLRQALKDGFYDFLNSYSIFLRDSNAERSFDGTVMDINTLENAAWGGTSTGYWFVVEPVCMRLLVDELDEMVFEEAQGSECFYGGFDEGNIGRVDVNIAVVSSTADYNTVSCDFDGNPVCPNEAFNEGNADPYLSVYINDENCSNCILGEGVKTIRGHVAVGGGKRYTVYLNCVAGEGSSCTVQSAVEFSLRGDEVKVKNQDLKRVRAEVETTFTKDLNFFYFPGFNFSVSRNDFRIHKRFDVNAGSDV